MKKEYDGPTLQSFYGWLQILFIGYKLAGIINWSWWLVMTPAIGTFVFRLLHEIRLKLDAKLGSSDK